MAIWWSQKPEAETQSHVDDWASIHDEIAQRLGASAQPQDETASSPYVLYGSPVPQDIKRPAAAPRNIIVRGPLR